MTEREVFHQIKWDPRLDEGEFSICFKDRTKRGLVEVPYRWVLEYDEFSFAIDRIDDIESLNDFNDTSDISGDVRTLSNV